MEKTERRCGFRDTFVRRTASGLRSLRKQSKCDVVTACKSRGGRFRRDGQIRENTELASPARVAKTPTKKRRQDLFFARAQCVHDPQYGQWGTAAPRPGTS